MAESSPADEVVHALGHLTTNMIGTLVHNDENLINLQTRLDSLERTTQDQTTHISHTQARESQIISS